MKLKSILIVCLIFFKHYNAICSKGTLQCNLANKSLICDFLNGYALNEAGDTCEKKLVDGCQIINYVGYIKECLVCEMNHIYDSSTKKCVEIPFEDRIQNCAEYSFNGSSYSCLKCESEYVVDGTSCVRVPEEKMISDCEEYIKTGNNYKCLNCTNGFYESVEQDACFEIDLVENCMKHSDRKCEVCEDSFFLNRAIPSQVQIDNSLYDNMFLAMSQHVSYENEKSTSVCQKSNVKNCLTLKTFDQCKTCSEGYFLNSSDLCEANPEDSLANCLIYQNATSCLECEFGFYVDSSDNSCKAHTAEEKCKTFYNDKDGCDVCKSGFYRNSNNPNACVALTSDQNCETFYPTQDGCDVCKSGFYRNSESPNSCSERTTINNCEAYVPTEDKCQTCEEGYVRSTDNAACKNQVFGCKNDISGADESEDPKCSECQNNFYLESDSSCVLRNNTTELCLNYEKDKDECTLCQDNYYLNEERTTCLAIEISNCENPKLNENVCEKCESLYYLNVEKNQCLEITQKAFCFESNGEINQCQKCLPKVFVASTGSDADCDTNGAGNVDSNCLFSTRLEDNTKCSACNDEHILFDTLHTQLHSNSNCEEVNSSSNGECKRCKQLFELQEDKTCAETSVQEDQRFCLQHSDNEVTQLDNKNNCAICNNTLNYYLDSDICALKTSSQMWEGCQSNTEGNTTCLECQDGYDLVQIDQLTCTGHKDLSMPVSLISDCIEYGSFFECTKCIDGKEPSLDGSVCEDSDKQRTFSNDFSELIYVNKPSTITNCAKYIQTGASNFECIQCETDFTGIIAIQSSSVPTPNDKIDQFGNDMPSAIEYNKISSCYSSSSTNQFLSSTLGSSQTDSTECSIGYQVNDNGNDGYCCLKFFGNKSGLFVDHDSPDSNDATTKYKCMTPGSDFQEDSSDFIGMNITTHDSYIQLSNILRKGSCPDGDVWTLNGSPNNAAGGNILGINLHSEVMAGTRTLQSCVTTTAIANCYLHGWIGSDPGTFTNSTIKCLVCNPSYTPNVGNTLCEQITDCPTSGGIWFNSCSNPTYGFKLTAGGEVDYVDLQVQANEIDNCLLHSNDSSECLICQTGMKGSSDKSSCEPMNSIENCDTAGWGEFSLADMTSAEFGNNLSKFRTLIEMKINSRNNVDCHDCVDKRVLFRKKYASTAGTNFHSTTKCAVTNAENNNNLTGSAQNCLVALMDDQGPSVSSSCAKCNDESTLSLARNNQCVMKSVDENCDQFENDSSCYKCKENFYVGSDGICVQTNCETWTEEGPWNSNSGKCLVCKEGHKLIYENSILNTFDCEPMDETEKENSICAKFSPDLESCADCKDPIHQVVRFEKNDIDNQGLSIKKVIGWKCVEKDLSQENYGNYKENLIFNWNISENNNPSSVINAQSPKNALLNYEWSFVPLADRKLQSICLPKLNDPNCMDEGVTLFCKNCAPTHWSDAFTGECKPNPENCTSALSETNCTACADSHFLNQNACVERLKSNLEICNELTLDADECKSCDRTKSFLNPENICQEGTESKNCATFSLNEDSCQTCEKGQHYLDSTNKICIPYDNAKNCLNEDEYHEFKDECVQCSQEYWLDTSTNLQECKLVTGGNCQMAETEKDSCDICKPNYFKISSTANDQNFRCDPIVPVTNCESQGTDTYERNSNKCNKCKEGHYKFNDGEECRIFPDGIANCAVYENRSSCSQCDPDFYLDSNECKAVENLIDGCEFYSSSSNCKTCKEMKFLRNNQCLDITATGCSTYSDEETCDICETNKVKDSNNKNCVNSGIFGCIEAQRGTITNTCNQCDSGLVQNNDKTLCLAVIQPISDCKYYQSQSLCSECESDYMLDLNKKSCVAIKNESGLNTLGTNCKSGILVSDPVCDVCYPGFKFDQNGKCISLKSSGCLVEDVTNESCLMCANTHYMTKDLECVKIETNNGNDNKFAFLKSQMSIFLLVILISSQLI